MNKKWNEMTPGEKKKVIAVFVYAAIALAFSFLNLYGTWENNIGMYMFSAYFLVEGVLTWKKNMKIAILDIVLALSFLINTF